MEAAARHHMCLVKSFSFQAICSNNNFRNAKYWKLKQFVQIFVIIISIMWVTLLTGQNFSIFSDFFLATSPKRHFGKRKEINRP